MNQEYRFSLLGRGPRDEGQPGINIGLMPPGALQPGETGAPAAPVCAMQAMCLDVARQKIPGSGGAIQLPKHALTGTAWQEGIRDTEGNLSVMPQADSDAKSQGWKRRNAHGKAGTVSF